MTRYYRISYLENAEMVVHETDSSEEMLIYVRYGTLVSKNVTVVVMTV
jgi:hypothetical protein